MIENVPNQMEDKNLQIQESNQSPNGINSKKFTYKHIITECLKTKNKKKKSLQQPKEMAHVLQGKNSNDCRFLIRKHGNQKEEGT